ncbi:acyl-coenzyme A thioesterase 5-like isoform X3 [Pygocentrus nattereri]|uniref:acyl-coenzyme A thioesterase 5-like isoform X3 n=1 Tax=Pygocentrus nattereri TaxID=42514 RepID=UPI00189177E8|nr:acyl-coenzyme A thioesterase 5-like isoform X3 [Pygocentrus nattereri]
MVATSRTLSTRVWPLHLVKPTRGLVDEKLKVIVRNLNPRQEVTLRCVHQDVWEGFGHYISDQHGTVTVAKDASMGGTYKGVEAMGLMWSMQPVPGSRKGLRTLSTRVWPLLLVKPTRGLVDEKLKVIVRNLNPRQEVTLRCVHQSEDKDVWEGFGHYISDQHGTVTVAKDASMGGTYKGVEAMGLMWSMQPVPGSRKGLRLRKKHVLSPMVFHISVFDGHITQGFSQLTALATHAVERWYVAPGVQRVYLQEKGVQGTLFIPPGPGPFPGLLDLWGGGGGLVEYRAALLASHGFVSFALEYLSSEEINAPTTDVKYFEAAYQILKSHAMVQKDRLALFGLSFGSTIALSMAAYSKIIKPRCCVCISGSHVNAVQRTLSETFQEIAKNVSKIRVEDGQVIWRDIILPIPADPSMKIDVGQIKCPVLLVNGSDDQNLATVESAEDMERMMEKAGNRHLLQVLTYPGAGHLIEPPYTPHHRTSNFVIGKDKAPASKAQQHRPRVSSAANEQ